MLCHIQKSILIIIVVHSWEISKEWLEEVSIIALEYWSKVRNKVIIAFYLKKILLNTLIAYQKGTFISLLTGCWCVDSYVEIFLE